MSDLANFNHYAQKDTFEKELAGNLIDNSSISFIKDTKQIYTHEQFYNGVSWRNIGDPLKKLTNGHDYVDMGDAGIWATCNVGANSPEEFGLYFQWGEVEGLPNTATTTDKRYDWSTYRFSTNGTGVSSSGENFNKYNNNPDYGYNGFTDSLTVLELEDDAAHVNMGGDWRMPSPEEFKELYDACDTTWVTNYNSSGKNGRLFTLKTDPSKQLFFPAAGYANSSSMSEVGSYGNYWCSSLYTSYSHYAYNLGFDSSVVDQDYASRAIGRSIRGFIPKQS